MANKINNIMQGESKSLPFLIKSRKTGQPLIGLANATFFLVVKTAKEDVRPVFTKVDADFDKSLATSGLISVWLMPSDTYQEAPFTYYGELRVHVAASPVPIYKIPFDLEIVPTGIPDALLDTGVSVTVAETLTAS